VTRCGFAHRGGRRASAAQGMPYAAPCTCTTQRRSELSAPSGRRPAGIARRRPGSRRSPRPHSVVGGKAPETPNAKSARLSSRPWWRRAPVPRSRRGRVGPSADVVMSASLPLSCGRRSARAFGASVAFYRLAEATPERRSARRREEVDVSVSCADGLLCWGLLAGVWLRDPLWRRLSRGASRWRAWP